MKNVLKFAINLCENKKDFAIATIIEGLGSLPRKSGSAMLVYDDAKIVGTIGGGVMEAEVITKACAVIKDKKDCKVDFDMTSEDVASTDLICGGRGTVLIKYYNYENKDELLKELNNIDNEKLYLLGAGHVSKEIARVCEIADIDVCVIDDRAEFANSERFSTSEVCVIDDFNNLPDFGIRNKDMIAIVTRGHMYDRVCLEWALNTKAGYIGMIGSTKKRKLIYDEILKKGYKQEQLDAVKSPIGLPIGGETPGEIAVSIVGELISFRAKECKK